MPKFLPGQSGNPGGRPKSFLRGMLEKIAAEKVKGDPQKRTYGELLLRAMFHEAIAGGDKDTQQYLCDQIMGRPIQSTDITSAGEGLVNPASAITKLSVADLEKLAKDL